VCGTCGGGGEEGWEELGCDAHAGVVEEGEEGVEAFFCF
jgi:hypothetical protein